MTIIFHYKGKLGRWLMYQRQAKLGKYNKSKLLPEHEAKLQLLVDEGNTVKCKIVLSNIFLNWTYILF